jgi:Cd2+/Zn2+-exporting ATPase
MGHATLWMAVIADMGSSLIVILNGLRTLRE